MNERVNKWGMDEWKQLNKPDEEGPQWNTVFDGV